MSVPVRRAGHYLLDGVPYPSVTTILQVINKPALIRWSAEKAANMAFFEPEKYSSIEKILDGVSGVRDEAASRGIAAHEIARKYIGGETLTEVETQNDYLPAIRSFLNTIQPEVIAQELTVFNLVDGYAGTLDLLAALPNEVAGKERWVIDYKTSKSVYPEHILQVEAYANCKVAFHQDGRREEFLEGIASRTAIVVLKPTGTFEWHEVKGSMDAFRAAMTLWRWLKK